MSNDPSAIATWANLVTVARILLSPIMFASIDGEKGSWFATGLWFVLCMSDMIDGSLARRHGATRSGAFLDPLADKVLVLGAMFTLVQRDMFWILPVLLITARELLIQLYRTFVGAKGVSVPATQLAKWKTFAQQVAVGFAVIPLTAHRATWLWQASLWIAVALTLVTGADYLVKAQKAKSAAAVVNA
jgi:CDP-diacylglycerol--glycerol-3-phosphate 3-phosphatidyltransferase